MQLTEKIGRKKNLNKTANQEKKIKMLLSLPIHLAHHCASVAPLLLRCHSVVSPLLHCCRTAIAMLSLCCRSAVALLLLLCRFAAVAPLSHRCRTAIVLLSIHCPSAAVAPDVATHSHCYRSTVAPLLSLLLSLRSRS